MTTIGLDKSKPHQIVKDFTTNKVVLVQNGKTYNEQGFPLVLNPSDSAVKYLCPQCDFRTSAKTRLFDHADLVHAASDKQHDVLKAYVKNIDRGLPGDEGIDWARMTYTPTGAQKAHDEREEELGKYPNGKVKADTLACDLCPTLPAFASKALLGTHRWAKHKLKAKK